MTLIQIVPPLLASSCFTSAGFAAHAVAYADKSVGLRYVIRRLQHERHG